MNKQTIINDLVARIPYGVVVNCTDGDVQPISVDFEMGYDNPEFWHDGPGSNINFDDDNIKPYLFPMSSMTKEERMEYRKVCELDTEILSKHNMDRTPFPALYNSQDWLNAHHYDYRGLIPAGAAIDATGKGIYPYVKKKTVEDESIKFPYPIGSRVKLKNRKRGEYAIIVGISYNSFGNKQYEILIDNETLKVHYPTELMTLIK